MRLLFLFSLCLIGYLTTAQPTIEVNYYAPKQDANGEYLKAAHYYTLRCNQESSLFLKSTSEDLVDYDKDTEKMTINFAGGKNWIYKSSSADLLTNYVTSFQEKHFLIEDQLHPMEWEVLSEEKDINGVLVQKARGAHMGRTYTAWFAPSIPINNGPWKLGGLPGLILEVYDDEKLVVFLFKSLRQLPKQAIQKPKNKAKYMSLKAFYELNNREIKAYYDFQNARLKKEGLSVSIATGALSPWEYLTP